MNIAIIDSDLIGRTKHRFPNLVCMKLSGYYKFKGEALYSSDILRKLYESDSIMSVYLMIKHNHSKRGISVFGMMECGKTLESFSIYGLCVEYFKMMIKAAGK